MRVAYLNMVDSSQQCPSVFRLRTSPKRVCERTVRPGCTSITFPAHGVQYSKVCGQARAYQNKSSDAFAPYYLNPSQTLEDLYVDVLTLTHGKPPRKHICTFAAAVDETQSNPGVCPCTKTDTPYTPFIGTDYFYETGSRYQFQYGTFYDEDPLWDGEGCGPTSSCCQFNSPPWFCKEHISRAIDILAPEVCYHRQSAHLN